MLIGHQSIQKNGIRTISKIVDIKKYTDNSSLADSGPRTSIYPIVEFITKNGEKVTSELNQGKGNYQIGQNVNIIYLKKGKKYDIVTNSNLWLIKFPIGMIIIGLIILSIIGYSIYNRINNYS